MTTDPQQEMLSAMKTWTAQTILHAMSVRAMDLGKDLGEKEMMAANVEARRLAAEMWDSSFGDEEYKPSHEIVNATVRKVFDWVRDHLAD